MKIPFEICLIILKQYKRIKWNLEVFRTIILNKESKTKEKILTAIYQIIDYYKWEKIELTIDDFEVINVRNTRLKIEIPQENFRTRYKFGYYYLPVNITSPEIDKLNLNTKLQILVNSTKLLNIISEIRNIEEGIIQSSFCLEGSSTLTNLEIEDISNKDAVIEGKLLSESKKTTRWIPGHRYLFTNRNYIVYLGEIKIKRLSYYSLGRENIWELFPDDPQSKYCIGLDTYKLFIYDNNDTAKNFNNIPNLIINKTNNNERYLFNLINNPRPAIDLGEIVGNSENFDLTSFISNIAYDTIINDKLDAHKRMSYLLGLSNDPDNRTYIDAYKNLILQSKTSIRESDKDSIREKTIPEILKLRSSNDYKYWLWRNISSSSVISNFLQQQILNLTDEDYTGILEKLIE